MSAAITVTPSADFKDMRFEQSATGHVRTCFFSFPISTRTIYEYQSEYHSIIARAKDAFAEVMKIRPEDVMVSSQVDNVSGDYWFRLSTVDPCPMPTPPKPKKLDLPEARGAIDI